MKTILVSPELETLPIWVWIKYGPKTIAVVGVNKFTSNFKIPLFNLLKPTGYVTHQQV